MIKADLIKQDLQDMNIPKQEAEEGVNLFFETIAKPSSGGRRSRSAVSAASASASGPPGPGATRGRASRSGPAEEGLYFKPSKLLKELINK